MSLTKKVLGLIFVGMLLVSGVAKAQSTADLQAQIAVLMAQIKALQAQLGTASSQSVAWCHTFDKNLRVGDLGSEISALHKALSGDGFGSLLEADKVKSEFSEGTASAVTGFQQKYTNEILTPAGLKYGTGFVGAGTRAKLNKLYGCGVGITPPIIIAPGVTVLSPNGGETYSIEKGAFTATWSAPVNSYVDLYLLDSSYSPQVVQNIASRVTGGSYPVTVIPTLLQKDISKFYLKVCLSGTTTCDTSNGPFIFNYSPTITPPVMSAPKITGISAKGNADFEISPNGSFTITGTNLAGNSTVGTQVYVDGKLAIITQKSETLIWATAPSDLQKDVVIVQIVNSYGTSEGVRVNVLGGTITTSSELPDLVVTNVSVSPSYPVVNSKDVEITVNIKNIGTKISDDGIALVATLLGFVKGVPVQGGVGYSIAPGETITWKYNPYDYNDIFKISDTSGEKTIQIVLNKDKKIAESNYDNNIFTKVVQIY